MLKGRIIIKALSVSILLFLAFSNGRASALTQSRAPIDLPVDMDVPLAPTPFKADGKKLILSTSSSLAGE